MAVDKYDILLVPRTHGDAHFEEGKMTIELDNVGDPKKVTGQAALEQDVLKAIFTGTQTDGYGTCVKRALGTKNQQAFRAIIVYTIMSSLKMLRDIQFRYMAANPLTFRGQRVLSGVDIINVGYPDNVSTLIAVDLHTENAAVVSVQTSLRQQR